MLLKGFAAALAALALAMPVALAATAPVQVAPGQKTDLRVLLVSADGTESGYGAWKAELDREGVPYDTFVAYNGQAKAATLDAARLADYAGNHAKYQAVILATGDLGHNVTNAGGTVSYLSALTDAEWATLAKYERTFGIRQLSDYTAPTPAHGLNTVGGASQDGVAATLTPTGKAAFPYLKGPVTIADDDATVPETFGYHATRVTADGWQSLLNAPDGTSFLGIYTHPDDGREEMVMTVASNQYQNHNQLLRHGMLTWVTRGVFLGFQRNYLSIHVDDLFLGDDAWNPATNTTDFALPPSRMTPADVDQAVRWSTANGVRLDFAYNYGGSVAYAADNGGTDPLRAKISATKGSFGFINHTYEHPNVDCSSARYITSQLTRNQQGANALGLPTNPSETVTGEHSGLANSRPGNPGRLDPPIFDTANPGVVAGGAVPAGTYDYALTASVAGGGETTASTVTGIAVAAPNTGVTVTFNAICHAAAYTLYRAPTGTANWTKVATLPRNPNAVTDDGTNALELTVADTKAAGDAGTPPASNGAELAPYNQNPNYLAGVTAAGIKTVGTDASKGYPAAAPWAVTGTLLAPGATFFEGTAAAGFQGIPRYPSNVYYNVSKQSQQLDEYNYIYTSPAAGADYGCVAVPNVTTCRSAPATWAQYVASENHIMFGHLMGNDPRPNFAHQSNLADYNTGLAETDPNQGGILYAVYGPLLTNYGNVINRATTPLVQPTMTQAAVLLNQQSAWAAASKTVTAYLQDGKVTVTNAGTAAVQVPVTGVAGVGDLYGGQMSGWTAALAPGATQTFTPADPANTAAPALSGTARAGETLTASRGTWTGTPTIGYDTRWQRCDTRGADCVLIAGATAGTYALTDADVGHTVRAAVLAGNWISSVSEAFSAASAVVDPRPTPAPSTGGGSQGGSGSGGSGSTKPKPRSTRKSPKLALTRLKMSPRTFAVSHRAARKGTKLDGSAISWRLNRSATVKLVFERKAGKKHKRYVKVGTITVKGKTGETIVRFRGRFGKKLLAPRGYRVSVRATKGSERTSARRVSFRVVKG